MGNRTRRHSDPLQCRVAISPGDWLEAYHAHGEGEIWLDLGCGKGELLAGLAAINPSIFFIGIEVRRRIAERYFPRYRHLPNLVLLHGNVNLSIPSMMAQRKVQRVFINFPDPYDYKPRYRKRQMVNERLVEGLCEILAPTGVVSLKTDNKALFDEMDALLSIHLAHVKSDPLSLPSLDGRGEGLRIDQDRNGVQALSLPSLDGRGQGVGGKGIGCAKGVDPRVSSPDPEGMSTERTPLTEWGAECLKKSLPVYSMEYRLR